MDNQIAVSWGGRVHLGVGQDAGGIHTACGKIRPNEPRAMGDWNRVPQVLRCEACAAAAVKPEAKPEVKPDLRPSLWGFDLAEVAAEAAERVGWWDSPDMRRIDAAARLGAWS